jgi:hypothetical protein
VSSQDAHDRYLPYRLLNRSNSRLLHEEITGSIKGAVVDSIKAYDIKI